MPRAEAERKLDDVLAFCQAALLERGRVNLPPFGTFEVRQRKARSVLRPGTEERMDLPALRNVLFRQAAGLRKALNAPPAFPAPHEGER